MSGETIFIRDNTTSEVRELRGTALWYAEEPETAEYMWSEGNYACDCNRRDFFAQCLGEGGLDVACGSGRYSVHIVGSDGADLYIDGDWMSQ